MPDKKMQLCISKIDEEATYEFKFARSFFLLWFFTMVCTVFRSNTTPDSRGYGQRMIRLT